MKEQLEDSTAKLQRKESLLSSNESSQQLLYEKMANIKLEKVSIVIRVTVKYILLTFLQAQLNKQIEKLKLELQEITAELVSYVVYYT